MDFNLSTEATAFRQEIKEVIDLTYTPDRRSEHHQTGTFACPALYQELARRGLLERIIPGLGKGDPIELWILFNELEKASVPYDALSVILIVSAMVTRLGSEFQRERILSSLISTKSYACLGYSEPGSGSDVASVSTRAVRDGDQWVINGSKMWTTMAHEADWILLLTRTDPTLPKHRGLTMFVLPMDTPGISVEPVWTIGSERTNATFFDDVRVGDEWVLGGVNKGWAAMGVGLTFERGVVGETNSGVALLRHFRQWAEETGAADAPAIRRQMAQTAIDNEVAKLLTQRSAWMAASGQLPLVEGAMSKLFATAAYQKSAHWFQQRAGAAGLLRFGEDGAAAEGWIEYEGRHAPLCTIRGGTTEINRNIVAERHLGLPKSV